MFFQVAAWISPKALACATCFGKSDSPLAAGMNMGILTLLGFILSLLAVIAGFFVYLARRAAKTAALALDPLPAHAHSGLTPTLAPTHTIRLRDHAGAAAGLPMSGQTRQPGQDLALGPGGRLG
jgi:hypothetical protein